MNALSFSKQAYHFRLKNPYSDACFIGFTLRDRFTDVSSKIIENLYTEVRNINIQNIIFLSKLIVN